MKVTIELDTNSSADMEAFRAVFGVGPAFDPAADVAEPAPEKTKRKRRTKAEIAADKAAEEVAKAHPDDEPTGKSAEASSDPFSNGYDFAAAKADLEKIRDHDDHGLPAVIEILKAAGVDKVNALDGNEKGLAAVRAEVEKRLG